MWLRGEDEGVRLEAIRKLLAQFQAKEDAVLDSDETLTESEIALGRLVLPLYRDREAMTRKLDDLSRKADALQLAVNHIPIAVLVLDSAGALLILNKSARVLFHGPAVPMNVLEEARRFVVRPVHKERHAEFSEDGKTRTRLRLILGQVRETWEPNVPQLVFAVRQGTTLPLTPEPLVSRFRLTRREAELVGFVAEGLTNKQIAERVGVSVETVRSHLAEAFAKSGAKNRAELVTLAVAAVFGVSKEEA